MPQDKEQGTNIVVVGSWNAEEHTEWAKKNVARSYQLKEDGVQKVKYGFLFDLTQVTNQTEIIRLFLCFLP